MASNSLNLVMSPAAIPVFRGGGGGHGVSLGIAFVFLGLCVSVCRAQEANDLDQVARRLAERKPGVYNEGGRLFIVARISLKTGYDDVETEVQLTSAGAKAFTLFTHRLAEVKKAEAISRQTTPEPVNPFLDARCYNLDDILALAREVEPGFARPPEIQYPAMVTLLDETKDNVRTRVDFLEATSLLASLTPERLLPPTRAATVTVLRRALAPRLAGLTKDDIRILHWPEEDMLRIARERPAFYSASAPLPAGGMATINDAIERLIALEGCQSLDEDIDAWRLLLRQLPGNSRVKGRLIAYAARSGDFNEALGLHLSDPMSRTLLPESMQSTYLAKLQENDRVATVEAAWQNYWRKRIPPTGFEDDVALRIVIATGGWAMPNIIGAYGELPNSHAWVTKGKQLAKQYPEAALSCFRFALQLDRGHVDARLGLADTYCAMRVYPLARAAATASLLAGDKPNAEQYEQAWKIMDAADGNQSGAAGIRVR